MQPLVIAGSGCKAALLFCANAQGLAKHFFSSASIVAPHSQTRSSAVTISHEFSTSKPAAVRHLIVNPPLKIVLLDEADSLTLIQYSANGLSVF